MSIYEVHGGPVTRRYLMNKSKDDLAGMYMDALTIIERLTRERDEALAAGCSGWDVDRLLELSVGLTHIALKDMTVLELVRRLKAQKDGGER